MNQNKRHFIKCNSASYNFFYPAFCYFQKIYFSLILLLIVCISCGSHIQAQNNNSGWEWNNGGAFNSISFIDSLNGYAVSCSRLFRTKDGGQNWKAVQNFTDKLLEKIQFINPKVAWISCWHNGMLHTNDGGVNWKFQDEIPTNIADFQFNDELNGWAIIDESVIATADGGETWNYGVSTNVNFEVKNLYFLNPLKGWLIGSHGVILQTLDGGKNWTQQNSGHTSVLREIQFIDEQNGWISGDDETLIYTNNGGKNWISKSGIIDATIRKVLFFNQQKGWAVDRSGKFLLTINGGQTWEQPGTAAAFLFSDIYYSSASNIIGISANRGILQSGDSGKNWQERTLELSPYLLDIDFFDAKNGAFVAYSLNYGLSSNLFHTADGGDTWKKLYCKDLIYKIKAKSKDYYCGIGANGLFSIISLKPQEPNYSRSISNYDLYDIAVSPDFSVWVVGQEGSIFYGNAIPDIKQNSNVTEDLFGVNFIDNLNGWIVGKNSTILHTTDGGKHWIPQKSPIQTNFSQLFFLDSQNGWIVGDKGVILHTTNGGTSWVQQTSGIYNDLFKVQFTDSLNGWALLGNATFIKTIDGGLNWVLTPAISTCGLIDFHFTDSKTAWAIGSGDLYKFSQQAIATDEPVTHSNIQVFPNPATDYLEIKINNNLTPIKYSIYDQLGKAVVLDKWLEKAEQIDISKFPSGFYVVKTSNNFQIPVKFIKM